MKILQKQGIPTAVVSMPCRLLFEEQDAAYKKAVGTTRARVAVEAAVEQGESIYGRRSAKNPDLSVNAA
jgi:transketolase